MCAPTVTVARSCLTPSPRCVCVAWGAVQGTLLTTGHSTNFIMTLELPTADAGAVIGDVADNATWIKAGVAALCSLRQ